MSLALYTHARLSTEALMTTSVSETSSTNRCPKCGIAKKSGERSCCARGGAWFKKCGDTGGAKFDHRWTEGIQACKGFASSVSDLQLMLLSQAKFIAYQRNTTTSQNSTQQRSNINRADRMSNHGTTDYGKYVRLAKVTAYFCVLFITS